MRGRKEPEPHVVATGAYRAGTRIVYYCQVEGCHQVSLGENQPYFGESVLEMGGLKGI
jgi:hypothetical protein